MCLNDKKIIFFSLKMTCIPPASLCNTSVELSSCVLDTWSCKTALVFSPLLISGSWPHRRSMMLVLTSGDPCGDPWPLRVQTMKCLPQGSGGRKQVTVTTSKTRLSLDPFLSVMVVFFSKYQGQLNVTNIKINPMCFQTSLLSCLLRLLGCRGRWRREES